MNYYVNQNYLYPTCEFQKNFNLMNKIKHNFYSSPLLNRNNFIHGFFTKESSTLDINSQQDKLVRNGNNNCYINQIHSSHIAFSSKFDHQNIVMADGLICDNDHQNLWIYTADCMPILMADKYQRRIAAIHCGRKGLEKNIISNMIKNFEIMGSFRKNILVAIGPSISGDNYLVDKKTYFQFQYANKFLLDKVIKKNIKELENFNNHELISLDIKKYAYLQLLRENINPNNIDISSMCTFSLKNEFHSWRRSKNHNRQWSVICSSI